MTTRKSPQTHKRKLNLRTTRTIIQYTLPGKCCPWPRGSDRGTSTRHASTSQPLSPQGLAEPTLCPLTPHGCSRYWGGGGEIGMECHQMTQHCSHLEQTTDNVNSLGPAYSRYIRHWVSISLWESTCIWGV